VVSNNANYIAGDGTESAQLSWDDAVTMFHEFGHALHGLNSDVTYATLSGTATSMDHAELPSQFHEHYLMVREILRGLLDKNGHAMPDTLIDKLERAQSFNQGFLTVEYVSAAIVDMKLHQWQNFGEDITEFVDKTLKELDMPTQIVMRHRLAHFNHVFGSEGYASLYYGYLWSQVLDNDAFAAFTETGNPFDPATAERFYRYVLSRGNSLDTREGYIQFRGREATADALLKSRGFQ
jgi:peptidyl-dipeptidase Dcp